MTDPRTSVQILIDTWPNLSDFAADAGIEVGAAKQMRRRSSIAPGYWASLVQGAQLRGLKNVSFETLGKAHAKPTPAESAPAA